jgi:hypothetical protein
MVYAGAERKGVGMEAFSRWVRWDDRLSLPQWDGPGVYVLARFEGAPPAIVDPLDERVLLIAETHDQTLAQRWRQFHRCATRGQRGHAGGRTFWSIFGNGGDTEIPGWLCVAASGVPAGVDDVKAYARGIKQDLLGRYEDRHGVPPACNAPLARGPVELPQEFIEAGTSSGVVVAERTSMEEPAVRFTEWVPWRERGVLPGLDAPGVYALARLGDASSDAAPLDERVVYLGETCDNVLRGRLGQFQRSAFGGREGHSGGMTYRKLYGDSEDALFVSVFAVSGLPEPHRSSFIRHVERDLLWKYVRRWGRRPVCNSR